MSCTPPSLNKEGWYVTNCTYVSGDSESIWCPASPPMGPNGEILSYRGCKDSSVMLNTIRFNESKVALLKNVTDLGTLLFFTVGKLAADLRLGFDRDEGRVTIAPELNPDQWGALLCVWGVALCQLGFCVFDIVVQEQQPRYNRDDFPKSNFDDSPKSNFSE